MQTEEPTLHDMDNYIQTRFKNAIEYYWAASRSNKHWYKTTRSLTIIFGALVTLVASLTSSEMINKFEGVQFLFSIATPILAASLTIIAGFSQSFQYGSAWQNMVLTAQQLQKEYDSYLVTPPDKRDYLKESNKLNSYVISETENFFERILGGIIRGTLHKNKNDVETGEKE
jgi:hypothetical protein